MIRYRKYRKLLRLNRKVGKFVTGRFLGENLANSSDFIGEIRLPRTVLMLEKGMGFGSSSAEPHPRFTSSQTACMRFEPVVILCSERIIDLLNAGYVSLLWR